MAGGPCSWSFPRNANRSADRWSNEGHQERPQRQALASPTHDPDRRNSVRGFGCGRHGHLRRDCPDLWRNRPAASGNELAPERLPASMTMDNPAKRTSWAAEDSLPALATPPDARTTTVAGAEKARSAAPAVATTTATGRLRTDTRTATNVYQSATLPATAPGAPTRPQAADLHLESLLMVYCLNSESMNTENLLNLLCLYGNVLPDGTLSFKGFIGNCNNRITNPEASSKNRILPPVHRQNPLILYHHQPERTATEPEDREGGREGGEIVGFAAHHRAKELVLGARPPQPYLGWCKPLSPQTEGRILVHQDPPKRRGVYHQRPVKPSCLEVGDFLLVPLKMSENLLLLNVLPEQRLSAAGAKIQHE
ncbi:hypothetical protein HPB47_020750 [Ixodes persulcatus]|uniref:Uncharacterized protein n=1 Tax=Ixodes persulcatus TaxID=34615 RepID=A0AC60QEQ9_IXOPE|nr:hypothetical protein HPB47_020750 [Ixodes persulcatus]